MMIEHLLKTIYWNAKVLLPNNNKKVNSIILLYHGIVLKDPLRYNMRFLTLSRFISQLNYFKKYFHFISIKDIYNDNIHPEKFNVAISFDDGYMNNYKYAVPELLQRNIPATFFITTAKAAGQDYLWTDFLDIVTKYFYDPLQINEYKFIREKKGYYCKGKNLKDWCKESAWDFKLAMFDVLKNFNDTLRQKQNLDYFELLTEREIKEMSSESIFEIGSHGLYHNCLTVLPEEAAKTELTESRRYLENIIGKAVKMFAYPDGKYTPDLITLTEQTGYQYQLLVNASERSHLQDVRLQERFTINPYLVAQTQAICAKRGFYD